MIKAENREVNVGVSEGREHTMGGWTRQPADESALTNHKQIKEKRLVVKTVYTNPFSLSTTNHLLGGHAPSGPPQRPSEPKTRAFSQVIFCQHASVSAVGGAGGVSGFRGVTRLQKVPPLILIGPDVLLCSQDAHRAGFCSASL